MKLKSKSVYQAASNSKAKSPILIITLPNGEVVIPRPGTVPTSLASVQETDVKKMIQAARAVSKAGIFDTEEEYGTKINLAAR